MVKQATASNDAHAADTADATVSKFLDAVWMEGTLRITEYDSPYGQVGYTIEGLTMKPYTGK